MNFFKKYTQIALAFFVMAVSLGLLMRFFSVSQIDFVYKYVRHAHSHVALMGWVYFALITLIGLYFLSNQTPKKTYNWIFGFTMLTVFGMLCSFPFQGYALFSIIFSSLFLISSYLFAWFFFKYTPNVLQRQLPSYRAIRYAIIYMLISSAGPWAIGGVMGTIGPDPFWYPTTIYFYLHFQYNAWIILGMIGVFLKILEKKGIQIDKRLFKSFLIYFNIGAVLTFFINILFAQPPHELYIISIFGAFMQLISVVLFIKIIRSKLHEIKLIFSPLSLQLLYWSMVLFVMKLIMQLLGSFPDLAKIIATYKYLTIGFLHWVFLGIITLSLFALLEKHVSFDSIKKVPIYSWIYIDRRNYILQTVGQHLPFPDAPQLRLDIILCQRFIGNCYCMDFFTTVYKTQHKQVS